MDIDPLGLYRFYKARFQIEFIFRDARQFTGLADCQARHPDALDSHVNALRANIDETLDCSKITVYSGELIMVMSSSSTTQDWAGVKVVSRCWKVREKAQRRLYIAEYKLRILQETDYCGGGQIGAILRREGLYSSHLTAWRRQRQAGLLAALRDHKRGRKAPPANPPQAEVDQLRRENQRLNQRLQQAELIIEIQKKSPRCWV